MVGGIVIGVSRQVGKTHVHVADCPHYPKHPRGECHRPDTCCMYTDEKDATGTPVQVQVGDSFWWQSGSCYWTPAANRGRPGNRCDIDFDIRLAKLGYSH